MSDDDYGEYEDIQEYGEERNVFERAGPRNKLEEIAEVSIDSKTKSIDQRFFEIIDKTCREMIDLNMNLISENDIDILLETAKNKVPGLKFKNPIGFIYGYIVTKGGRDMKPEYAKKIIFPENERSDISKYRQQLFKNNGIEPPDIIKYGRLWLKLK